MGVTHSNTKTYPRLADVIGFITPDEGLKISEAVILTQRDHGNRANRKNARLKYTIDRLGLPTFVEEVEKRFGKKLPPPRPFKFVDNIDHFGWAKGHDGKHHFTMFIENGRVQDEPGLSFKTGLREIAKVHKGVFRLTANQHLILSEVPEESLPEMKALLAKYKLDNINHSGLRHASSACVAFPTCGLAMAESERYLPVLVDKVELIMEKHGLRNDHIVMRMSGCPNGCSRSVPLRLSRFPTRLADLQTSTAPPQALECRDCLCRQGPGDVRHAYGRLVHRQPALQDLQGVGRGARDPRPARELYRSLCQGARRGREVRRLGHPGWHRQGHYARHQLLQAHLAGHGRVGAVWHAHPLSPPLPSVSSQHLPVSLSSLCTCDHLVPSLAPWAPPPPLSLQKHRLQSHGLCLPT
jgi:dissimilatory sulfite reductase (desulfoviridin) alpha/beta subunit